MITSRITAIFVVIATLCCITSSWGQEKSRFFLIFCARDNTATGHAFVVWGKEDAKALQSTQSAYGFYSSDENKLPPVFGDVKGAILQETFAKSLKHISDRLILEVDEQTYTAAEKEIKNWATADYNLYTKNCIHFIAAVAGKTKLKVPKPEKFEKPSAYMKKLIDQNP